MAESTSNRRSGFSSEIVREETLESPVSNESGSGTVGIESPPANGRSSVASSGPVRYDILHAQSPVSSRGAVSCETQPANDRNSVFSSGSVRYEILEPPISSSGYDILAEVSVNRGRLCSDETVEYAVPQLRSQLRENSTEQSSSGGRDDLPIANTRHASRAVPSTASHQSQFLSQSSGLQLLGIHTHHKMGPAKKTATLFSNNISNTVFLAAMCGIILVGVTGIVLGTLAMKGVLCHECSLRNEEPGEMTRQEFSSLQKLVQDLQSSVINSTLSATVNVTGAHEECKIHSSSCTIFPFPQNYTYPNPVCTTPQLKISKRVSWISF